MADIYTFSNNNKTLKNLYYKRFANGDLIGALLILKSMRARNGNDFTLCEKFCEVYYSMRRYVQCVNEAFAYLSAVDKIKNGEMADDANNVFDTGYTEGSAKAYCALGAAFYKLDMKDEAGYYFDKQIKTSQSFFDIYTDAMESFFEYCSRQTSGYRVVSDEEKFLCNLETGDALYVRGAFHGAISEFQNIKGSSKYYKEALYKTALCYYSLKDEQTADKYFTTMIKEYPNYYKGLFTALSVYYKTGRKVKVKNILAKLKDVNFTEEDDIYRALVTYCEVGMYDEAEKYIDKYFSINPYDVDSCILVGQLRYNQGDIDDALKYFTKAYQISESVVTKSYVDLIKDRKSGKDVPAVLEFTFDLQIDDRSKILDIINYYMTADIEEYTEADFEKITYLVDYAYQSDSLAYQSVATTILASIDADESRKKLTDALLSTSVLDSVKSIIVSTLVLEEFDGYANAVFCNAYRRIRFYKTEFSGKGGDVMADAYSLCFAKLVPFVDDLKPLSDTAKSLFYDSGADLSTVEDVNSLAAVIFELSKIMPIAKRREMSQFFDANLKEIKRIKELFKGKN